MILDTECKRNVKSALTESGITLLGEKWLPKLDTKAIKRAVKNPDIGVLPASVGVAGGFMAYKVCNMHLLSLKNELFKCYRASAITISNSIDIVELCFLCRVVYFPVLIVKSLITLLL